MTRRISLLIAFLLAQSAFGQFNVSMWYECNEEPPLTTECGGATPLPDGTTVEFFWDQDGDGPDADDELAPAGPGFGEVNYNTLPMNGETELGCSGGFYTSPQWGCLSTTPSPTRYWLRICYPATGIHYRTEILSATDAPGVYGFHAGPQECALTFVSNLADTATTPNSLFCVDEPCEGCLSPSPVTGAAATNNLCNGINVTWDLYTSDSLVNAIRVYRGNTSTLICDLPASATSCSDPNAPDGSSTYIIIAHKECGPGDTANSGNAEAPGFRNSAPATPTITSATENLCGQVTIMWTNAGSQASTDTIRITRNGAVIHQLDANGAGQSQSYTWNNGDAGRYGFRVEGWNASCGAGTPSAVDTGEARQAPVQVTGVTASNGQCSVTINWTLVPNADDYQIHRNGVLLGSDPDDVPPYEEEPPTSGTMYAYTVRARRLTNPTGCQDGPQSASANGSDIDPPNAPSGVVASDTICTHVRVTWTDNSNNETGFIVRRGATSIDTVGAGVTTFNDSLGTVGITYAYSVMSLNDCGPSAASATENGVKLAPLGQVTGVSATDNLTDRVTVTWNNIANETGYRIFRNAVSLNTVAADITTYHDMTATPGVMYGYSVAAMNQCGDGTVSAADSGSLQCPIPTQVSDVQASDDECDLVVTWSDVADEESYEVYRDGSYRASVTTDVTTFIDDQALGYVQHSYAVVAVSICGTSAMSAPDNGMRFTRPQSPFGLTASDAICGRIEVTWLDVSYEDGYLVRRNGTTIGIVGPNITTYNDPVGIGAFSYRVYAFNICGTSLGSLSDSGHTDTAPTMQSLTVNEPNCDRIELAFSSTANADTTVLLRDDTEIARLLGASGVFEDIGASYGSHNYNAYSIGDCGVSNMLGPVAGSLLQFPSLPASLDFAEDSCSSITVSWLPANGDFGHYEVYRESGLIATLPNTDLSYVDEGLMGGEEYSYWVIAVNDTCGSSEPSDTVSTGITVASDPDSTFTVIAMQGSSAVLHWTPVDSTIEGCPVTVTHYLVFYSPTEEGPFYYHGLTSDTTYLHTGVIAYAPAMFYTVTPMTGAIPILLRDLEPGAMTREEVLEKIPIYKFQFTVQN